MSPGVFDEPLQQCRTNAHSLQFIFHHKCDLGRMSGFPLVPANGVNCIVSIEAHDERTAPFEVDRAKVVREFRGKVPQR